MLSGDVVVSEPFEQGHERKSRPVHQSAFQSPPVCTSQSHITHWAQQKCLMYMLRLPSGYLSGRELGGAWPIPPAAQLPATALFLVGANQHNSGQARSDADYSERFPE